MVANVPRRSKKNLMLKITCDKKDDPAIKKVYKFLRGTKPIPQKKIVNVEKFKKIVEKYKIFGTEIFIATRTIGKEKNYTYFKNAGWSEDTEVCKRYLGLIKNITHSNTITNNLVNTLNKAPENSWVILVVQHQNGINIGGAQRRLERARRLAQQRQQARQQAAVQRIRAEMERRRAAREVANFPDAPSGSPGNTARQREQAAVQRIRAEMERRRAAREVADFPDAPSGSPNNTARQLDFSEIA